jgi:hypothetical protein
MPEVGGAPFLWPTRTVCSSSAGTNSTTSSARLKRGNLHALWARRRRPQGRSWPAPTTPGPAFRLPRAHLPQRVGSVGRSNSSLQTRINVHSFHRTIAKPS